jgi:hypothetical protein
MNSISNTHTCAICLEELIIPAINSCITECAHVFHLNCLLRNREHNIRCPICRKEIHHEQPVNEVVYQQNENVLPDGMIEDNNMNQIVLLTRNSRNRIFEEIWIGTNLDDDISGIVSSVADVENNQIEPIISQIQDVCIQFGNSCLSYFRNILQHDIHYLNYNINIEMNIHIGHFYNKIVQIINNAINNNIQNNMTVDRMENDIRNLCFEYSERVIFNE